MKGQTQHWLVTVRDQTVVVRTNDHNTAYYAKEKAFTKLGCDPTNDYSAEPISEEQARELDQTERSTSPQDCTP